MKHLILVLTFLVSGLFFSEKSSTEILKVECEYWYEYVLDVDGYWLYEYCGDKLISVTPIDTED